MAKYIYKDGRGAPSGLSAQELGEELDRIRISLGGAITPTNVVEASKPSDAILHPHFEWNNTKASHLYREHQARNLLNIVVIVHKTKRGTGEAQAFVNIIGDDSERSYQAIADVMATTEGRETIIQRYLERLVRMQREFRNIREFAQIVNAIDDLAAKVLIK
jgi:hypothetical protein